MVGQIYTIGLQLHKANFSNSEAPVLGLDLFIRNDIVSSKLYKEQGNFNFEIVNFPFLDGDIL